MGRIRLFIRIPISNRLPQSEARSTGTAISSKVYEPTGQLFGKSLAEAQSDSEFEFAVIIC
ncbi:MAG TPA: hypothetical protein VGI45_14885 [Terracidiphilus sp.]|jgi:hypothetical protein